MAESLLIHVLLGEVHLDHLLEWIKRKNSEPGDIPSELLECRCSQIDFLSYFLNYIHDEAPCSNTTVDNAPQKVFATKTLKKHTPGEDLTSKYDPDENNTVRKRLARNLRVEDALNSKLTQINGFSTPKVIKSHPPENELNTSYMSPVSPLYSNSNFNTPKNKRLTNSTQKSSERSLCLGDFIVHKGGSGRKKAQRSLSEFVENECEGKSKKSRRINPTKLNQAKKHGDNFQGADNSFNFQSEFVELHVDNTDEQRSLLVKIASEIKFDDATKPIAGSYYNLQSANKPEVKPDCKSVTHRRELDVLAEIYGCVLRSNLVLNLTSELYFLMQLLTMKCYASESNGDVAVINTQVLSSDEVNFLVTNALFLKTLLNTVHNSVYFAVRTLGLLAADALHFLDRSTIKLLIENENVRGFSDLLGHNLSAVYEEKAEQFGGLVEATRASNVCFILDTDNRENFPTDASFHAFRKQRDLFYDILRVWEQNHCVSGWSFSIALGGKIKSLLNLHSDPVNFRHFARLFKAQLLTTSGNSHNSEGGMTETEMSFLSAIPNVDADKLCRLKSRLVTKQITEGLNSLPQFPGQQEFYKEFIVASSMHAFHIHLRDALTLEILQLNDSKFGDSELNETETNVDLTTRASYLTCVKSLRILGKFLGFLESLAYTIDCKVLSEKVLASEIKTRRWLQPAFDLKLALAKAIENKTLILTIPWLVKYLSMLDYVTLRLPYFEDIFKTLFYVHLNCKSGLNGFLLRLSLGWLFELPHFPSGDLYFRWYTEESPGDCCSVLVDDNCGERATQKRLDELDIVDTNVLYTCCPYLDEIKKVLVFNSGGNNTVIKHITPLSAIEAPADVSGKKLKAQLEEAFFNGQPISVRKTVEFVSERVASACVKFICSKTVPDCKKSFSLELQKETLEGCLPARADSLAQDCLKNLQIACLGEAEKMARERIPVSIEMLLSNDDLVQVRETCSAIAKRMCFCRVQQWMNSHVNLGIFNSEIQKQVLAGHTEKAKDKPAFLLPPSGRPVSHNPDTQSAVKLMEIIRQLSIDVLDKNPKLTAIEVNAALEEVKKSLQERCDVNDSILSVINKMLLDLCLLLVAHQCDVTATSFIDHWVAFVKPNEDLFKTIFSPRNVMLLAQSGDAKKSWGAFTQLIIQLLTRGLLTSEALESQCVRMYQNEWDEATLKHLASCFRAVVDEFVSQAGGNNQDFTGLLSFISGFCSDMDVL